jgi:hypothetical protein
MHAGVPPWDQELYGNVLALSLSAAVAQAQTKQFSTVFPIVTLYSKDIRALTFQNLCDSPCR